MIVWNYHHHYHLHISSSRGHSVIRQSATCCFDLKKRRLRAREKKPNAQHKDKEWWTGVFFCVSHFPYHCGKSMRISLFYANLNGLHRLISNYISPCIYIFECALTIPYMKHRLACSKRRKITRTFVTY